MKESLAPTLTPSFVAANRISTTDIVLNKGAVIAGTIRFDDGEPEHPGRGLADAKDKSGK